MEELVFIWSPQRIDQRLTTQFLYSRSFFHKLISSKKIFIISRSTTHKFVPKKSYMLLEGDVVLIYTFLRYVDWISLEESPQRDIDVCYECEDYLVVYKPKWVLSHPTNNRNISVPSVVGSLYHHKYKNIKLVHRLDMDTDGYMILAKNESTWVYFKDLFAQKSKKITIAEKETVPLRKYYRALCEITDEGTEFLENVSKKLPLYIEQMVTPNVPYTESKMGITKITSIGYMKLEDQSVICVEMEILTGRTHQVRCHLSDNGLPIISDIRYGASKSNHEIQLTAWRLEFLDVHGEMKKFG